jgi:two-component system phosphate regulon sensor histidine kinase PhoR
VIGMPRSERRLALAVLLLVGAPSVALAVIACFYVSEAQDFVDRRYRESVRELGLALAGRLDQRLSETAAALEASLTGGKAGGIASPDPDLFVLRGDASGLRSPPPSGPSAWERAYAAAFDRCGGDARQALAETQSHDDAPWAPELRLRAALERAPTDAEALWLEALPLIPPDLARETLARMGNPAQLRQALADKVAQTGLALEAAAAPRQGTWQASLLKGGELALLRQDGATWQGGILTAAASERLLVGLAGERPAALGVRPLLSPDAAGASGGQPVGRHALSLVLQPIAGPARDPRSAFYVWAVLVLTAAVAIGSWVVAREVRREARDVRARSDLLSTVSHELKTPLTSIRMFVDTLLLNRVGSPQERQECLGLIARETDRLSRMIEQVLTLARLEGGARRLDPRPTAPSAVLEEACAAVRAEAAAAGITVRCRSDETVADFRMDEGAMTEVLTNLLSNAIKYSPRGREVLVEATAAGPERPGLKIAVVDEGPGIPLAEQEKVFERFFRGSAAAATEVPGTGLGLAIARALVQGHGGRLTVQSEPGRGSRFTVWLPGQARREAFHA